MKQFVFESRSEADTEALGGALAEWLPNRTVVELNGPLGAGKTRLTQGLAAALDVDRREVVSPTFVLVKHYYGRRTVHHVDAYRVADDDEFLALGPEEWFEDDALTLIEWGSRVERCLPAERLEVRLEPTGIAARTITIRSYANSLDALVSRLAQWATSRQDAVPPAAPDAGSGD